ncbi:MAG: ribonuclease III [Planctomycetes bacterium]|nr:ribonuclease III [Planctomycetota bacterium]
MPSSQLESRLRYEFRNAELLRQALTHRSHSATHNERLEFLGDSILGLVICEELFSRQPTWLEGDLTKVKSVVVSRKVCAYIADEIGLTDLLILGNGVSANSDLPMSLRAAVFESAIGALYLDGGLEVTRRFVLEAMAETIDECAESDTHENFKSVLQQHAQRFLSASPRYEALDEQGPDHSKCFEVCVVISGERFPGAWGPTKKQAEQSAARRALEVLGALEPEPNSQDDSERRPAS